MGGSAVPLHAQHHERHFTCEKQRCVLVFVSEMDGMAIDGERRLAALADDLQARGRYTFTRGEALATARRSDVALAAARRRLEQRGRIASLRRGFYVLVPLEYREAGCPPASWFIDDLMRFLGQPYYVGLLSAAALHGAAHQQPMAFQVVTDRPTRPARAGRVRIEFHMSRHVAAAAVVQVQTETGTMRVSTPEITAFDLVRFAAAAGHLSNVASVLGELGDKLDPAALAHVAPSYAVPEAQRLGYLLDHLGALDRTRPLSAWIAARRHRPVRLSPGEASGKAAPDPRWRVIPNATLEVDI